MVTIAQLARFALRLLVTVTPRLMKHLLGPNHWATQHLRSDDPEAQGAEGSAILVQLALNALGEGRRLTVTECGARLVAEGRSMTTDQVVATMRRIARNVPPLRHAVPVEAQPPDGEQPEIKVIGRRV